MAYEDLAFIFSGYTDGSASVGVSASAVDGTGIIVCNEDDLTQLGTGSLLGNEVLVTVSPALIEGQRVIAFVSAIGEKTMGGRLVLPSGELHTGWKRPETVTVGEDEQSVSDYEAETGNEVPDVYDPTVFNRVAELNSGFFDAITDQDLSFNIRIDRNYGTTTVTVEDVKGAPNGFLIQFDSDAEGNTDAKTYSANGSHQVKVIDADVPTRFTIRTFVVTATSPPPVSSEISNMSYTQIGLDATIVADSTLALEGKIDGVGGYADFVLLGGKRWVSGTYTLLSAGTYTMRARVKSDTADEIVITATIY